MNTKHKNYLMWLMLTMVVMVIGSLMVQRLGYLALLFMSPALAIVSYKTGTLHDSFYQVDSKKSTKDFPS